MIQKALRRDNTDLWPQIQNKKFIPFPVKLHNYIIGNDLKS